MSKFLTTHNETEYAYRKVQMISKYGMSTFTNCISAMNSFCLCISSLLYPSILQDDVASNYSTRRHGVSGMCIILTPDKLWYTQYVTILYCHGLVSVTTILTSQNILHY